MLSSLSFLLLTLILMAWFLQGIVDPASMEAYTNAALYGLSAVITQIGPSGEVHNVSFGTALGHTLQFYKDIPLTPMPYGQALAMLALVEWQRWKSWST